MQNVVIVIRSFNVYDLQNLYRNMMNLYSSKSGGGGGSFHPYMYIIQYTIIQLYMPVDLEDSLWHTLIYCIHN